MIRLNIMMFREMIHDVKQNDTREDAPRGYNDRIEETQVQMTRQFIRTRSVLQCHIVYVSNPRIQLVASEHA